MDGTASSERSRAWLLVPILAFIAAAVLLAFWFLPRFYAVYQLFWSQSSTHELFYEQLGFSEAWSSFIAVVFAFFYTLVWIPLAAWTIHLLAWNFNWRQLFVAVVCWVVAYGNSPLAHALLDHDVCFNQKTGQPLKWYTVQLNGEIVLSDSPGFDPTTGQRKQPVTSEICDAYKQQSIGRRPRKVTLEIQGPKLVDEAGRPLAWYHKDSTGKIDVYNAPGVALGAQSLLMPITKANETTIRRQIEPMILELKRQVVGWLLRDKEIDSRCATADPRGTNLSISNFDLTNCGMDQTIFVSGSECFFPGARYGTIWLYSKAAPNEYHLVMAEHGMPDVKQLPTATNGFVNLLSWYVSAQDIDIYEYHFDGNKYALAICMNTQYRNKENDPTNRRFSPQIGNWRFMRCPAEGLPPIPLPPGQYPTASFDDIGNDIGTVITFVPGWDRYLLLLRFGHGLTSGQQVYAWTENSSVKVPLTLETVSANGATTVNLGNMELKNVSLAAARIVR